MALRSCKSQGNDKTAVRAVSFDQRLRRNRSGVTGGSWHRRASAACTSRTGATGPARGGNAQLALAHLRSLVASRRKQASAARRASVQGICCERDAEIVPQASRLIYEGSSGFLAAENDGYSSQMGRLAKRTFAYIFENSGNSGLFTNAVISRRGFRDLAFPLMLPRGTSSASCIRRLEAAVGVAKNVARNRSILVDTVSLEGLYQPKRRFRVLIF